MVDPVLIRLSAAGVPDTTFDGDGIRVLAHARTSETPVGLALDGDGRLVLAGNATVSFASTVVVVRRLLANGTTGLYGGGPAPYDYVAGIRIALAVNKHFLVRAA